MNSYLFIIVLILLNIFSLSQSIICPDSSSKCRDDMTCCQLSSGRYGCCPLESAECCSDGLHCCPNGTKCDDKEGTCHPIIENKSFAKITLTVSDVCPDKNHSCAKSETCCKEKSGDYGCCPYNLAVCCKDLLHCCPHGTRCDLIHRQCVRLSKQIKDKNFDSNKKIRLIGFKANNITNVVCPGGRYDCPDGNTCCRMSETKWGCCPMENAVCCDDSIHCCPNGYKCFQSGCQTF